MSLGLTFLFAVVGGAAVGNLYWSQPLLDFIATDLKTGTAAAGWLVTATQLGYAVGILLILPLGDVLDRKRLIPAALVASGIALTASAFAPTFGVLLGTLALVGLTTVSGQILVPLAGDLADDPAARSRINTAFVTNNFVCGAIGSGLASALWAHGGWTALTIGGAVLSGFAFRVWAVGRRGALRIGAEPAAD